MTTVRELAQGLARRGETIAGLRCYPVMHPKPEPPCLCVAGPIRWTYDETMETIDDEGRPQRYWRPVFECWLFVNPADLFRAQESLHAYLAPSGPKSLPAAIYGDPTLGGLTAETRVLGGSRPPGEVETGGGRLLGCALEVEVLAM